MAKRRRGRRCCAARSAGPRAPPTPTPIAARRRRPRPSRRHRPSPACRARRQLSPFEPVPSEDERGGRRRATADRRALAPRRGAQRAGREREALNVERAALRLPAPRTRARAGRRATSRRDRADARWRGHRVGRHATARRARRPGCVRGARRSARGACARAIAGDRDPGHARRAARRSESAGPVGAVAGADAREATARAPESARAATRRRGSRSRRAAATGSSRRSRRVLLRRPVARAAAGATAWDGVRNHQARNFLRDAMQSGDLVLVYHSSAEPPGVAGVARIASARAARPDAVRSDRRALRPEGHARQRRPGYEVDVEALLQLPALRHARRAARRTRASRACWCCSAASASRSSPSRRPNGAPSSSWPGWSPTISAERAARWRRLRPRGGPGPKSLSCRGIERPPGPCSAPVDAPRPRSHVAWTGAGRLIRTAPWAQTGTLRGLARTAWEPVPPLDIPGRRERPPRNAR